MIPSPNHSTRGGKAVRLVVIHTAEGSRTVESLGSFFANAASQVSSHAGIDDNRVETYVPYTEAAWTARSANQIADQVELCGFAAWTRDEWLNNHHRMLELTAQWIRGRCAARGIPVRKLTPAELAAGQSGVIGHVDWTVGMKDGTHQDPGNGFPWDVVMAMAAGSTPTPAPAPSGQSRADILAANGMLRAPEIVELADAAGLDLAAACAMLAKESGNASNVWGHDQVSVAPNTYTKGGPVTEQNYAAYKAAVAAGKAGHQGCGPAQLTDGGLQAQADAIGGCWDWRFNITIGFKYLVGLIKARGLSGGFRAYNAGPSATGSAGVAYAADAMNRYATWHARLANAVEDDMTPDQDARLARVETMLRIICEQLNGAGSDPFDDAKRFTGWEAFAGGSVDADGNPVKHTLVDIGRSNDVTLNEVRADLDALKVQRP